MIFLPGDKILVELQGTVKIGPGLYQENDKVIAVKSGLLNSKDNNQKLWMENNQKRYIPALNDPVVGIVVGKTADFYRVDIGGPHPANLQLLAFEGATKKNHPNLPINALVYAKVTLANKDMEPELECLLPGFTPLVSTTSLSFLSTHSLFMSRILLSGQHPIWDVLSKKCAFEVAVGVNGKVWVSAADAKTVIFIVKCLELVEGRYNLMTNSDDDDAMDGVVRGEWVEQVRAVVLDVAKKMDIK